MGLNELYNSIVDDVIDNLKEAFSEEGVEEDILKHLKEGWLRRINESRQARQAPQHQPTSVIVNNLNNTSNNNSNSNNTSSSTTASSTNSISNNNNTNKTPTFVPQLDGSNGTSDEDNDDDESDGDFADNDDDVDVSDEEDRADTPREEEDPLNSGDDVSNDESSEMFETDNVVVCQYDKITRNRNKWKFHLKDGIMNINGRDYVFQKAVGDAEWWSYCYHFMVI